MEFSVVIPVFERVKLLERCLKALEEQFLKPKKIFIVDNNVKKKESALLLHTIKKFKTKRDILKSKIKDKNISLEERISYQNKLNDLPRNGSAIRYRNRCEVTGRPRGNYRKFGLSRIKLRELSMSGDLPGVVKSSW